MNSADDDSFTFLPTTIGAHTLQMAFSGLPVPSVPRTIEVREVGRLRLHGTALERATIVGEAARLLLDTRRQAGGLKIVSWRERRQTRMFGQNKLDQRVETLVCRHLATRSLFLGCSRRLGRKGAALMLPTQRRRPQRDRFSAAKCRRAQRESRLQQ